jgi:23S rRNA (pseudouridine1915-N3)-methyltransferase
MRSITLLSPGKSKDAWLESALQDYQRRLRGQLHIDTLWVKTDRQLVEATRRFKTVLCLDPQGKQLDSLGFASLIEQKLVEGGSRLALVIGGAEGLPQELRQDYPLLSLSSLTMTHQIVRLVLLEQLYRATEIWRGSPYHK